MLSSPWYSRKSPDEKPGRAALEAKVSWEGVDLATSVPVAVCWSEVPAKSWAEKQAGTSALSSVRVGNLDYNFSLRT